MFSYFIFFLSLFLPKDQFTVLRLKFGTIALDYEQSPFFLVLRAKRARHSNDHARD